MRAHVPVAVNVCYLMSFSWYSWVSPERHTVEMSMRVELLHNSTPTTQAVQTKLLSRVGEGSLQGSRVRKSDSVENLPIEAQLRLQLVNRETL